MSFRLEPLPLPASIELETPAVLRQLARSHRYLAELKGAAATIPNEATLIDTLALREARDSSAIENIITTEDELFRTDSAPGGYGSVAAKEVHRCGAALKVGFSTSSVLSKKRPRKRSSKSPASANSCKRPSNACAPGTRSSTARICSTTSSAIALEWHTVVHGRAARSAPHAGHEGRRRDEIA